ncbi:acetate--CoA ligase [Sulfuriroseicoccus oceanibius]|uniref:Acetyl-coenzyme A synthetase n=1 Tax=Sulfuriroseicoccus oceanibius TaxID=2707525 RepID=A0A6B3L7B8_9BACT|nr:acetate--CoA ligase [Sulfuriroseicoccus oceanibius]QQL43963.1 acetate--CoA ligase [Sulfuriroseicoccus oceanibius]
MSDNIESHLQENRTFAPPAAFSEKARIKSIEQYEEMYRESIDDPDTFWAREANELKWQQPWDSVCIWNPPHAEWFTGAKVNITENCLDRHLENGNGDKTALLWEGEPGDKRSISYRELHHEVCLFANALKNNGITSGDRVLIYMPMVAEAVIAMLACARIGAVHSVVFGGFSADSIKDRLEDSQAVAVITADGGWRRGKIVPLKANVDEALASYDGVKNVFVLKRCENDVTMTDGRDMWWEDETAKVDANCPPVALDAEHPLFILYTSGSTGKPKGILHTTGGYMVGTYATCKYIFDMQPDDVYWCTADVGWITGHSYIAYGPLLNGCTQVIYEGAPNHPDFSRFWQMVEEYKVSIFYTAPTAIRAFIKAGDQFVDGYDLSSLRLLGTVGEPINPEAWMWYYNKIGGGKCPIVDTWWQTETGAIMISPIPGAVPIKPGTATRPFFGVDAAIFDETGQPVGPNEGGKLVIRKPWPSMLRTIYNDDQRFKDTYWSEYEGVYLAGDGARTDSDGNFWIVGRLDDVLNVSGHRLGTAEVESALVAHPAVAEAAVVGRPDDLKGQAVVAFVTVKTGIETSDDLAKELRNHVGKSIGAIAKPDDIKFASTLPKTRSGKIMRRLLKEICATGKISGDTTTLEDFTAIAALQK